MQQLKSYEAMKFKKWVKLCVRKKVTFCQIQSHIQYRTDYSTIILHDASVSTFHTYLREMFIVALTMMSGIETALPSLNAIKGCSPTCVQYKLKNMVCQTLAE